MGEKIARFISLILHPFLLGISFLIYLSFFKEHLDFYQVILILTLDFLIPASFILFLLKKRIIKNLDISDRTKRRYFYFPVSLFLILTMPLFFIFRIPEVLTLFQVGFLVWVLCWAIISLFYKISGHVGGASFIYTTIIFLLGKNFWFIFLLLPLLAWSRVKLKEHTVDETITGGVLGFLISFVVFRVLGGM